MSGAKKGGWAKMGFFTNWQGWLIGQKILKEKKNPMKRIKRKKPRTLFSTPACFYCQSSDAGQVLISDIVLCMKCYILFHRAYQKGWFPQLERFISPEDVLELKKIVGRHETEC